MDDLGLQTIGLGRLLLAGLLCALIGWDRERKNRPAGLRTHMTVGVASTVLVIVVELLIADYGDRTNLDPTRVLEATVGGVAFLGAGTIVQSGPNNVLGLTTAASLLAAATVGIAVGLGAYVLSVGATGLFLVILVIFGRGRHGIREGRGPGDVDASNP